MSPRFSADHNFHAAIVGGLRGSSGVDLLTSFEDPTASWDDEAPFGRACPLGRVPVTHDRDHLAIEHRWQASGREFSGLVHAHPPAVPVGTAARDPRSIASAGDEGDLRDRVVYLPLLAARRKGADPRAWDGRHGPLTADSGHGSGRTGLKGSGSRTP